MKIVVCAAQVPFVKGGAEILSEDLCAELLKRNHDVEYVNIPIKWYPPKELLKNALVWRLIDLTESDGDKIDLVVCTKFPSYLIKHTNKIVWLFHQHRPAYDLYHTEYNDLKDYTDGELVRNKIIEMDNISLNEASKMFTISKLVSKRLDKYNNIKSEALYPPPRNMDKFYNKEYGNYILYPSRLDLKKRQHLLIEAMRFVKSDVKCKIVGVGNAKQFYVDLVKKYKLHDKIEFLGYVDEETLIDLYANSLAVAFLPLYEDYGYVTIESFLSEKPVITLSDSGGPTEFVDNTINGYVLSGDPKEIAEKIDYLYDNKNIAKKLGIAGKNKIDKMDISWDNVIKKLIGK